MLYRGSPGKVQQELFSIEVFSVKKCPCHELYAKNLRSVLALFRLGILPLNIGTGMFKNIAVENRVCTICHPFSYDMSKMMYVCYGIYCRPAYIVAGDNTDGTYCRRHILSPAHIVAGDNIWQHSRHELSPPFRTHHHRGITSQTRNVLKERQIAYRIQY